MLATVDATSRSAGSSASGWWSTPSRTRPQIPDDWEPGTVPLSSLVRGTGAEPDADRGLPPTDRAPRENRTELEAMVHTVVVEQVAELLGLSAGEVDPRYDED